jgi:Uma2 family endonuclease
MMVDVDGVLRPPSRVPALRARQQMFALSHTAIMLHGVPDFPMENDTMAATTILSEQEYRQLVESDDDHIWELWDGVPVEKPLMSMKHDDEAAYLAHMLMSQLDRAEFRVNVNGGKTRYTQRNYFVPDVVVIPTALMLPFLSDPHSFNAYDRPLPLVVEIWSPSTGDYDVAAKLPVYRQRGDHEIWFFHPYERTLSVSRKQPDGSYTEERYTGGIVPVHSLPGVSIDLDVLLDG